MTILNKTLANIIKIEMILVPLRMVSLFFSYKKLEEYISFEILTSMYAFSVLIMCFFIYILSLKKNWFRITWVALFFMSLPFSLLSMYNTSFSSDMESSALLLITISGVKVLLQSWCVFVLCTEPVKFDFTKQPKKRKKL